MANTTPVRQVTSSKRDKVFGPGRAVPLDRNAKCRITFYARCWSARNRQPGQHKGPITRAALEVLLALLWKFHNARDGRCFPSYEKIAAVAGCARSTVAEALKVLEFAGVLTWQHRITRIRERCADLFGRDAWRWRVIRTSNAYVLRDPASESEIPTETRTKSTLGSESAPPIATTSPLERAIASFRESFATRGEVKHA